MQKQRLTVSLFLTTLLVTGCGGNSTRPAATADTGSAYDTSVAGAIQVQQITPYANNTMIDSAVRRECDIDKQLPHFIDTFASAHGMQVALKPVVKSEDEGNNLVVEIVKAQSSGNAFIGHRKYTEIKAILFEDGKQVADLTAGRYSGGGLFAGFKGSCSVMGRTVEALGKDISLWLKAPGPGMRSGDI